MVTSRRLGYVYFAPPKSQASRGNTFVSRACRSQFDLTTCSSFFLSHKHPAFGFFSVTISIITHSQRQRCASIIEPLLPHRVLGAHSVKRVHLNQSVHGTRTCPALEARYSRRLLFFDMIAAVRQTDRNPRFANSPSQLARLVQDLPSVCFVLSKDCWNGSSSTF